MQRRNTPNLLCQCEFRNMAYEKTFVDGFLESKSNGRYEGELSIEGISLSPIVGVMFKENGKTYLWLRRKDMLVYDMETQRYIKKKKVPQWEAYLEKHLTNNLVSYKGVFCFMRFRFSIVGIWDNVFGRDKKRINFFVERLPQEQQDIINELNDIRKK